MTKRTPLERHQALRQVEIERAFTEAENALRIFENPKLSPGQRLEALKKQQDWPRTVLGLYRAERDVVDKKDGRPSEVAHEVVGEALGLGPDRIRDLCREGRRHQRQGMPAKAKITASEFRRQLSITVTESEASELRQKWAEKKTLAHGGTVLTAKRHPVE